MKSNDPDFDVQLKNRDELKEEVIKLRKFIREKIDADYNSLSKSVKETDSTINKIHQKEGVLEFLFGIKTVTD